MSSVPMPKKRELTPRKRGVCPWCGKDSNIQDISRKPPKISPGRPNAKLHKCVKHNVGNVLVLRSIFDLCEVQKVVGKIEELDKQTEKIRQSKRALEYFLDSLNEKETSKITKEEVMQSIRKAECHYKSGDPVGFLCLKHTKTPNTESDKKSSKRNQKIQSPSNAKTHLCVQVYPGSEFPSGHCVNHLLVNRAGDTGTWNGKWDVETMRLDFQRAMLRIGPEEILDFTLVKRDELSKQVGNWNDIVFALENEKNIWCPVKIRFLNLGQFYNKLLSSTLPSTFIWREYDEMKQWREVVTTFNVTTKRLKPSEWTLEKKSSNVNHPDKDFETVHGESGGDFGLRFSPSPETGGIQMLVLGYFPEDKPQKIDSELRRALVAKLHKGARDCNEVKNWFSLVPPKDAKVMEGCHRISRSSDTWDGSQNEGKGLFSDAVDLLSSVFAGVGISDEAGKSEANSNGSTSTSTKILKHTTPDFSYSYDHNVPKSILGDEL